MLQGSIAAPRRHRDNLARRLPRQTQLDNFKGGLLFRVLPQSSMSKPWASMLMNACVKPATDL
jgi:hypothetical protein